MIDENLSYIYGLFLADGNINIQKHKGKARIELQKNDEKLLYKLASIIGHGNVSYRIRDTNFKDNYESAIYSNCKLDFCNSLIKIGFPLQNKSFTAAPPTEEYSKRDFWRGVIDGDGSIGYTKANEPFISLITNSLFLKNSFIRYLKVNLGIVKIINRNKRDKSFNITVKNEEAIKLFNLIYSLNDELFLERKYISGSTFVNWERERAKKNRQAWTTYEDNLIQKYDLEYCCKELNRTKSAIKNRLFRLKQANKEVVL